MMLIVHSVPSSKLCCKPNSVLKNSLELKEKKQEKKKRRKKRGRGRKELGENFESIKQCNIPVSLFL